MKSMTGFGSKEGNIPSLGKVSIDIRTTNHKFLETVVRLPESLLGFEERIKKEIESRLSRGRVICTLTIVDNHTNKLVFNQKILDSYIQVLNFIKRRFSLKDEISLDTIVSLPGVFSLMEHHPERTKIWPRLRGLLIEAIEDLMRRRTEEGRVLQRHIEKRANGLRRDLKILKQRFQNAVRQRLEDFSSDDERSNFLKTSDINEEIERLAFHIRNLIRRLMSSQPVGKEIDFIAQEMQREVNTIGAKSCATGISAKVVEMKSKIEKIREQAQNIE